MNLNDVLAQVVAIHNQLIDINVRGDDAILMAQALQECRSLVYQLKEAQTTELEATKGETHDE